MEDHTRKIIKGVIFFLVFLFLLNLYNKSVQKSELQTSYSQFIEEVQAGKIKEITIKEKANQPREISVLSNDNKSYTILGPQDNTLIKTLLDNKIKVTAIREEESLFLSILLSWFPTFLLIGVWIYFMRKGMGGKGGIFSFNKSKANLVDPSQNKVTFADVVGCDEAKEEVKELVDFLKNPKKFSKLGARVPRGVLLTGPAGVGKTMLAKALAGESGVPFMTVSGSSFVEMFVGVGAGRVRDMFTEAKKLAPCIIFIDEIDAIGGKRGQGIGGGNDEREGTLNQLLVEMDGIETNNGVIIIGATNRVDMLDPALMRPGRLDRQVVVQLPDVKGREEILKVHAKNVPVDSRIDLAKIARGTPGFSGADLANLINEAAIFASRNNKKFVEQSDFEAAKDKIIMGPERRSILMPEKEKTNTAYHESGHAIVARLLPNADPVHKVTVIPRGRALGVTMQLPQQDKYSHDREYLNDMIAVLMGGRLAEEIFLNHMTTGASNDIERATALARKMVTEWGMSNTLGPLKYGEPGYMGGTNMGYLSPETLQLIDKEVRKIVEAQYEIAKNLLEQNKDKVEAMTAALLEVETIDDWQIENIMNNKHYNENADYHKNINENKLLKDDDQQSDPEIKAKDNNTSIEEKNNFIENKIDKI